MLFDMIIPLDLNDVSYAAFPGDVLDIKKYTRGTYYCPTGVRITLPAAGKLRPGPTDPGGARRLLSLYCDLRIERSAKILYIIHEKRAGVKAK